MVFHWIQVPDDAYVNKSMGTTRRVFIACTRCSTRSDSGPPPASLVLMFHAYPVDELRKLIESCPDKFYHLVPIPTAPLSHGRLRDVLSQGSTQPQTP